MNGKIEFFDLLKLLTKIFDDVSDYLESMTTISKNMKKNLNL